MTSSSANPGDADPASDDILDRIRRLHWCVAWAEGRLQFLPGTVRSLPGVCDSRFDDGRQKSTGFDRARIAAATPTVIDDMPREYGQLSNEQRSWDAMIGYLYAKHLQGLGVLK